MGISMENLCYYWDCKSFSLRYYRICIRDRQPYTHLDLNCYRICILFGNSDRAQTYPPTSALILTLQL